MSDDDTRRVAINTLAHVTGGGITYFENVLPRLADDENEYFVLVPAGRNKITRVDASNIRFVETSFPVGVLPGRLFYEQVIFPLLFSYWDIDVLFSPADLTPLLAPCPSVLAIRNPNPYFHRQGLDRTLFRRIKFRLQRYLTWLSARKASKVFFVSEFSRDISADVLGLDPTETHVIYHGIDRSLFEEPVVPPEELRSTVEEARPYLLTVSTINEHKNYETLLRGFARLPDDVKAEYTLVIAGRNSAPEYFERLKSICRKEEIDDQVRFLGEVDYEYIPYLYEHASVYVLPSKLETFGHTLVEAMASEKPIVAADATCIPEITDGAAMLFDPDDPDSLAESVETVLTDEGVRSELVAHGRDRVADFSWDRTVERTKALLTSAAQSTRKTERQDD